MTVYNELNVWRIPTLEGISPRLIYNTPTEEEEIDEEFEILDYYLLTFFEDFCIDPINYYQVQYSVLHVWKGMDVIQVGAEIKIDNRIPIDFLDRWLINAVDNHWEARLDNEFASNIF